MISFQCFFSRADGTRLPHVFRQTGHCWSSPSERCQHSRRREGSQSDVASPSHLLHHISRWISFIYITLNYVTLGYAIHYHIRYTVLNIYIYIIYHIESHCISHHINQFISSHIELYHIKAKYVIADRIISYHIGFYHIISYHIHLCHIIPCCIMFQRTKKTYLDLTSSNIKWFDSNIWRLCEHSHHANFLLSHPEIQSVQWWFHPPKFRFSALRVR